MPLFCEKHQQYYEPDNQRIDTPLVCSACERERRTQDMQNPVPRQYIESLIVRIKGCEFTPSEADRLIREIQIRTLSR